MRAPWILAPLVLTACAGSPPQPACAPAPAALVAPPPSAAPPPAPPAAEPARPLPVDAALRRLFTTDKASEAWFAPEFVRAVPLAKIDAITSAVRADAGALEEVRADGPRFSLVFTKAIVPATAAVDAEGRFTTLFLRPAELKDATVEQAMAALKALPGKVSAVVVTDGAERASVEPDLALGVGSTFKLAILAELRSEIDAKKRAWRDVVELSPAHRSLPSGQLQNWPDRAPMTVYGLAGMMISISDNTATDELLALVGRAKVEALAPSARPFLATREMFLLKAPGGEADLAAFRAGGEAEKRKVLDGLAKKPLPAVETYPKEPTALDVEWFFSARDLCKLMGRVADLPLMTINPGLAKKSDWDRVAFKGGSEPGVMSMTTWLEKGGKKHCVSATWNAPAKLDEAAFHAAYGRAIAALKK